MPLTDVVLSFYLEELPSRQEADGSLLYDLEPLLEAGAGAFVLGCALGIEAPDTVASVLEQTHPGEVAAIVEDCTAPLVASVEEAQGSGTEMGPHVLSIAFEYGCILATVERRAALVVRNGFNRHAADGPTIQETARRILAAYEADYGFDPRPEPGAPEAPARFD